MIDPLKVQDPRGMKIARGGLARGGEEVTEYAAQFGMSNTCFFSL